MLKNFSSLKAIISSLQSNPIYRLRKTWGAVSKEKVNKLICKQEKLKNYSMQFDICLSMYFISVELILMFKRLFWGEGGQMYKCPGCSKSLSAVNILLRNKTRIMK